MNLQRRLIFDAKTMKISIRVPTFSSIRSRGLTLFREDNSAETSKDQVMSVDTKAIYKSTHCMHFQSTKSVCCRDF